MDTKKKDQDTNKEILFVDPKPIEQKDKKAPAKVQNIKIEKIDNLTLNVFAQPLKNRYEKHYKGNKIHLITDLVLIFIIIVLIGVILNIWLFSKSKLINLIDFQVTSSPDLLINGQETEFNLDYTNTTKETLTDVTLVLKIPQTLHQAQYSLEDFNTKTNTLKIGELAPHSHGQFKVSGFLLGDLDTKQEFLAVINYKNKYGQDRQEFFSQDFELNGSALQAKIILKDKAIATSPFTTKVNVKNTSDINFDNLKITMVWPEKVTFIESTLGDNSSQSWTIGNYKAGQENDYEFIAKAYIDTPKNITIKANFYATYDNNQYLLAKAEDSLWVDFSKFILNFTNMENNQAIHPGETAIYAIKYKNNENYAITNVELSLFGKGEYGNGKTTAINQNTLKQLSKIEPGQEAVVTLPLTIKSTIDFDKEKENYNIEVHAVASYDDPNEKARISVESQPMITKINSSLSLNTAGLFYTSQGDQLGVGSIPPVVGEYTSYWVILKAINTNNNIHDLKITAQIPAGVEFTDVYNVTAGNQIVYQPENRTISWTVGEINKFAGIFNPAPEARIQLAIVPGSKQVGTSPALLTNITATATDSVTGAFLTAAGKNITTAIFADEALNKVIE